MKRINKILIFIAILLFNFAFTIDVNAITCNYKATDNGGKESLTLILDKNNSGISKETIFKYNSNNNYLYNCKYDIPSERNAGDFYSEFKVDGTSQTKLPCIIGFYNQNADTCPSTVSYKTYKCTYPSSGNNVTKNFYTFGLDNDKNTLNNAIKTYLRQEEGIDTDWVEVRCEESSTVKLSNTKDNNTTIQESNNSCTDSIVGYNEFLNYLHRNSFTNHLKFYTQNYKSAVCKCVGDYGQNIESVTKCVNDTPEVNLVSYQSNYLENSMSSWKSSLGCTLTSEQVNRVKGYLSYPGITDYLTRQTNDFNKNTFNADFISTISCGGEPLDETLSTSLTADSSSIVSTAILEQQNSIDNANQALKKEYLKWQNEYNSSFGDNESSKDCSEVLGETADVINTIITLVRIAVPIIIILLGTFDLSKASLSGDPQSSKKAVNTFIKRLIIGVFIFFIPMFVDIIVNAINNVSGDSISDLVGCNIGK